MVYAIFNDSYGVLANLFHGLGLEYVNISRSQEHFRSFLVFTSIWKSAGWSSIIYLAAITNIDTEMYEAAIIDGANKWHRITRITLPCISPIIAIVLIFAVGAVLSQDFEQIYMLSGENAGLLAVSDTFESYVFREGIRSNNFSFPAAINIFQSFFGMWLILGVNRLAKKLGYEGIW
jgi:putative aldouronate transport system permease protein